MDVRLARCGWRLVTPGRRAGTTRVALRVSLALRSVRRRGAGTEARARRSSAIEDGHGHWVEVMDPASHAYYYCDSHTHEVTWDKPEHYVMAADDEEMHAVILVQTAWRMRKAREAVARRAQHAHTAARGVGTCWKPPGPRVCK